MSEKNRIFAVSGLMVVLIVSALLLTRRTVTAPTYESTKAAGTQAAPGQGELMNVFNSLPVVPDAQTVSSGSTQSGSGYQGQWQTSQSVSAATTWLKEQLANSGWTVNANQSADEQGQYLTAVSANYTAAVSVEKEEASEPTFILVTVNPLGSQNEAPQVNPQVVNGDSGTDY